MTPADRNQLEAGDDIEALVDVVVWEKAADVTGKDGRRKRLRRYSRSEAAAFWALDMFRGMYALHRGKDGLRHPVIAISFEWTVEPKYPGVWTCRIEADDWWCEGEAKGSLPLAICRAILHQQDE